MLHQNLHRITIHYSVKMVRDRFLQGLSDYQFCVKLFANMPIDGTQMSSIEECSTQATVLYGAKLGAMDREQVKSPVSVSGPELSFHCKSQSRKPKI